MSTRKPRSEGSQPRSSTSKFRKYSAEKRDGDVKDVAEFTSFAEGNDLREGFYKMHKDGEDSLHREKGKSEHKSDWTVEILDAKGDKKTPSTKTKKYGEANLQEIFDGFKEISFSKSGGRRKRGKKSKSSSKSKSSKKSSTGKSPSRKRKSRKSRK